MELTVERRRASDSAGTVPEILVERGGEWSSRQDGFLQLECRAGGRREGGPSRRKAAR
jgi:hypothetical protein